MKDDELRIKVAKVLGWKTRKEESQWIKETILEFYINPDGTEQASPPPNYPNDLNACAELLDRARDNGWLVILERKPPGYPQCGPWRVWMRHGTDGGHIVLAEEDDKLPRAICLAFVRTMEEKK